MVTKNKVDGTSVVMPTSPRQRNDHHQPQRPTRASPTTEEFYDPLPYKRFNLVHQTNPLQQQNFSQNQQHLQYDQFQGTTTLYPGIARRIADNGPGIIEPVPVWPVITTNRNSSTSETRESSSIGQEQQQQHQQQQPLTVDEDSNPIPIQTPHHILYHQQQQQQQEQPLLARKIKHLRHYEIGQPSTALHIPKQRQKERRKIPIPTTEGGVATPTLRAMGEATLDSFQGRPFFPPQQQYQQYQHDQHDQHGNSPMQQHAPTPSNPNYFHLPLSQSIVPAIPVKRVVALKPSRGTSLIPTSSQQNTVLQKRQVAKSTDGNVSQEKTAKTKMRPWHRRSSPGSSSSSPARNSNDDTALASTKTYHSYIRKVHQMLEEAPTKGFDHIVSWQPHGRAFKIHKPSEFAQQVLPLYFETKRIAHFSRWLGAWGFVKHREGVDKDAFYHRYFVRGVVLTLASGLSRKEMFDSMQGWLSPGEIPDFSAGGTLGEKNQPNRKDTIEDDDEDQKSISNGESESHHRNPRRLRGTILETVRQMLDEAVEQKFDHIVSWLPGGRSFKVHDTVAFQERVCGNYFQTNLLRSFSDTLRTWGFCRLWEADGIEKNAYYHRLFRQGKPHLCRHYSRAQMLNAMKDFREEQKRQKEISWSLFPRHREEHQKHKRRHNEGTDRKLFPSSSLNDLSNVAKTENVSEVVLAGEGDDLSDDEDITGPQEPLNIDDVAIPNPIPQPQDYLMPYLDIPNENSAGVNKRGNGGNSNAEIGNRAGPSYGENYGMGSCYQMLPPRAVTNTTATCLTSKEEPKVENRTQKPVATAKKSNPKRIHNIISRNERETGLSYVIRISMMLEGVEKNGNKHIISWRSHGRAFKINDEKAFESDVLPRYFSATSLASFHRWLNKWGFLRIRAGKDRRCWYHRLFVRGVVDLLKNFTQRQMFASMEEWRAPGKEPNFYCSGKGYELSELTISKHPNKKQKTEKDDAESLGRNNNDHASSEEILLGSGKKELSIGSPLLQPQTDPKSLRGTLVENLREMLDVVSEEGNAYIVSWLPHGKAFKIHNQKFFCETILHRFFGVSKYRYFGDVLRSWGFVLLKNGRDKGAFYHKCFVQNEPGLSLHLSRKQLKASMKDWPKGSAPNFYNEQHGEEKTTTR